MVRQLKWLKFLVALTVVFLFILVTSTLLYPAYHGYFTDLSFNTRAANLTYNNHHEKTEEDAGEMLSSPIVNEIKRLHDSKIIKLADRAASRSLVAKKNKTEILLRLSSMKLPKYDKSFRNPCWHERYRGKTILRCLPYFYLAGFPKCSTTDLYFRLAAHPLIISGTWKENHYLSILFFSSEVQRACNSHFHCGSYVFSSHYFTEAAQMISMTNDTKLMNSTFLKAAKANIPSGPQVRFLEAFPHESLAIWKEGQKIWKYPGVTLDGSTSTVSDYRNFRHIAENRGYDFPRNHTADWIRKLHPAAKIILILRDPVPRAYSDYVMRVTRREIQPTASDFHERILESIHVMKTCLGNAISPLVCTSDNLKGNLHTGLYYYHIKSWFEKFPREQFLILRFEDYIANVPKTLGKVFKFLDLPAISQEGLEFISKPGAFNPAGFKGKMLAETKTLLTNFYRPYNKMLANLMEDDGYLWNEH